MPSNPNYMEVCPPAQAVGWMCGSMSVTPANLLRNISNTHAYIVKVPKNNPSFHPMFHTEKLLEKLQALQSFLLSRWCYRTPGNNVPSPNPRILYVSSLPSPQQSDTGNTFSFFNFWSNTLSYTDNFSLKLTCFLSPLLNIHTWVGYFTGGWAIPFQGFTYFKPTQLLQICKFYVPGKRLYLNIAQVQQLLSSQHSTTHHWYE